MSYRMQITLDAATQVKVRRRAESIGIPVAEYVRRVIAADLGDGPSKSGVAELFDLGRSSERTDEAPLRHALVDLFRHLLGIMVPSGHSIRRGSRPRQFATSEHSPERWPTPGHVQPWHSRG